MEKLKASNQTEKSHPDRALGKGRGIVLALCALALIGCLAYSWMTRDTLVQLAFLRQHNANRSATGTPHKALVSIESWQTASTLAPMATTVEEQEFAHNAEQLADHAVDQAFADALRQAAMRARHLAPTAEAQSATQKVADLEKLVRQDEQQVHQLGGDPVPADAQKKSAQAIPVGDDDLELARTQLSLDSAELADARKALAAFAGDNSEEIQQELNSYHLAEQQAITNSNHAEAEHAVASAQQHRTLLMRLQSWQKQNERMQLLQQAASQAAAEQAELTTVRANTQKLLAASVAATTSNRLEQLRDRNNIRQILAVEDDRLETSRQLAKVYAKWTAQVELQHRILLHILMASLAWIFVVVIGTILADLLAQHLLAHPSLEPRQARTLRSMTRLGIQIVAAAILLLFIFGFPQELSTMLGLSTAALTIALQDFVLAFFGWFLLVGRNGIHVGDWVEINGVNGEVVEVGLFNTTLLELGSLAGKGHPTGRRISFINSFAIRGQYFNFSTSGQWMWDDVSVGIPKNLDVQQVAAEIEKLVREKTAENAQMAERDWMRVVHGSSLSILAASTISMRPTVDGIEATVHYVTRAPERFAIRDRLYLQLLELLQGKQAEKK
ncbi:mechanosensitive ion channel family protein [Telmatobacter bradus]|uniref:mechanosensitive ion channel family protein n=1 Tax=Telmatobacter bradus TaxID=474953 RepID=UPI003B43B83F